MSAGPSPWSEARHVLGVRLDNMGDVLMSTPALHALRAPGRRISLLTSSAGAALAPHLADVDDVLAYDASWVKREGASADGDRQAIERLRELRPDAAVIFTVHSQSALPAALMLRLAGVPRVLAYSRENPYQLLTDWVSEPEPHRVRRHEVLRQLTLVRTVGATTDDTRLGFLVREIDRVGLRASSAAWAWRSRAAGSPRTAAPARRRGAIRPNAWRARWRRCAARAAACCSWAGRTRAGWAKPWRPGASACRA